MGLKTRLTRLEPPVRRPWCWCGGRLSIYGEGGGGVAAVLVVVASPRPPFVVRGGGWNVGVVG
jgi:hypothetical protein